MNPILTNNQNTLIASAEKFFLQTPTLIVLTLISVIGASPWLPLFDLDEGAFSEATREILESGNWVSTYLNGEPRYDKPILIYWLQAISVQVFGLNPFALRLPSMLAAFVWVFAIFRFCKEFYSEKTARIAVWVVTCSWLATAIFKGAIADALLNCLLNLIFFDIYRYYRNPAKIIVVRIAVYLGLAFLTKGPIAIFLPGLTSLIAFVYVGQFGLLLRALANPFAWIAFFAIVLPWHVAVYLDQGYDFFKGFYLGHNVGRFQSTMEKHGGSIFFYAVFLPFILAPFTRIFFVSLAKLKPNKNEFLSIYFLAWFAITFILFSFSQTQLPHYLLYGLTPLFIIIASRISEMKSSETIGSRLTWVDVLISGISALFVCLLPALLQPALEFVSADYERATILLGIEIFESKYVWLAVSLSLLSVTISILPKLSRCIKVYANAFFLMLGINFIVAPVVAYAQQEPVRQAAEYIKSSDKNIVAYKIRMPSFSVYTQRIVPNVKPTEGDIVFTKLGRLGSLSELNPGVEINLIFTMGGIVLYQYGEVAHEN